MIHKKIIEKALGNLEPKRAEYFGGIARALEEDGRTEANANIIYTVLKDVMDDLPTYIEKKELIELIFKFVEDNYTRLREIMYDRKFIQDQTAIRKVTRYFVQQIISLSFDKLNSGEITLEEKEVHKLTWPYRDTDVIDPEEEPEAWAEAVRKTEKWRNEYGKDRRSRGHARIDEVATDQTHPLGNNKKV